MISYFITKKLSLYIESILSQKYIQNDIIFCKQLRNGKEDITEDIFWPFCEIEIYMNIYAIGKASKGVKFSFVTLP